jgi:hypothetical protein
MDIKGGELVRVQKGKAVLHCTGGAPTARLGFSLVGRPGTGWTGREGIGFGRGEGQAKRGLLWPSCQPGWQLSGHSEGTAGNARTNVMTALSAFPLHVVAAFFFLSTHSREAMDHGPWTPGQRVSPPPLAPRCEIRRVSGDMR